MFDPAHPIEGLTPASYNPRKIDAAAEAALRDSLRTLGVVRPIIATRAGTLVAGHQRTRAMRAVGITHAPAYILGDVNACAEIRFNQLHNASDVEICPLTVRTPPGTPGEWSLVPATSYTVSGPHVQGSRRNEILRLLSRHGAWSAAIAGPDGVVVVGHLYASACKVLGMPLLVRYVDRAHVPVVRRNFSREYGEFSYAHLPKTTWIQTLAQKVRLRGDSHSRSALYETVVIPRLGPGVRVLDFGCGQGDYVKALRARGLDVDGVEFYRRAPGRQAIDVGAVHAMIDDVCRSLRSRGLFDVVVCDSVLNSVDSLQAESDVLTCVNALCRPGGTIAFSGRSREFTDDIGEHATQAAVKRRQVHFLDADGFTAIHQGHGWLYQKYHTAAEALELGRRHVGPGARLTAAFKSSWQVAGAKALESPGAAEALAREFDLPWPGGRSVGRSQAILDAWEAAPR